MALNLFRSSSLRSLWACVGNNSFISGVNSLSNVAVQTNTAPSGIPPSPPMGAIKQPEGVLRFKGKPIVKRDIIFSPGSRVKASILVTKNAGPDVNVPVLNFKNEKVGEISLPGDVFNAPVRKDILQRVVRWQRAKRQQGTHSTKTRGEVRGGGRKPWAQKGTGRARQGSIRAPQWKGGGVVFGPKPRSHAHELPKKVRRLGLKSALSAKATEKRLLVLDSLAMDEGKTKLLKDHLATLLGDFPRISALMSDSGKEASDGGVLFRRASNNVPGIQAIASEGLNVYDILKYDVLVLTKGSVELVTERLRRPIHR